MTKANLIFNGCIFKHQSSQLLKALGLNLFKKRETKKTIRGTVEKTFKLYKFFKKF